MTRHTPLPLPADPDHSFLVRDAIRLGHGRHALAHPRWHRPFAGVRSAEPGAGTLYHRAQQYVPRLRPGERFSHATALALLGCPIRVPRRAPVEVSSPVRLGQVECRGVVGHRYRTDAPEYLCTIPDRELRIPVSAPLNAVLQSATTLPFLELVVALDHLLLRDPKRYDPRLYVLPEQLARFADSSTGRGVIRFREAAALARVGAESRMETLMRLAAVRVGLPELELQLDLYDARGAWIGRFDAVDRATRTIYEYDGQQHAYSLTQRRRDACKHQAARDAGWRIKVLFDEELLAGALPAGRTMLEFAGRTGRRPRSALAKLLDERSGTDTEAAHLIPRPRGIEVIE